MQKTFKNMFVLVCVCLMTINMTARNVTPDQALQQAQNFLQQTSSSMRRSHTAVPQLKMAGRVSGLYVFNAEQDQGFVVVSNDDRTAPILGYSQTGSLDPDNMPCNMRAWLQGYADEIAWLNEHNIQSSASQAPHHRASAVKEPIAPLIKTHWNQDAPYNDLCPYYKNGSGGSSYSVTGGEGYQHCATGCVATAMAQVMYHNQWPIAATTAIPAYTWNGYSLELPATTFDWDHMQLSYDGGNTDEEKMAVATLMQYCGYSLQMNYDESSAASTANIATVLKNYFDYAETVLYVERCNYTYANWIELIYNELKQGRAVVYRGSSEGGGHSFICDGYEGEDFFHFNWGWGGTSDDYFKLSATNPYEQGIGGSSSNEGFIYQNGAVVGIQKKGETGTVLNDVSNYALIDNGVTFSDNPTQNQEVEMTLTIGNEGTDDFDGDIGGVVYYESSGEWIHLQYIYCHAFIPVGGGTATLKYTPPYAGNYAVNLYESNYILDANGDLLEHEFSVAAGSPVSFTDNITLERSASVDGAELVSGSTYDIYGTVYNGTLTVRNPDPSHHYRGTYQCDFYEIVNVGGSARYSLVYSFVNTVTIQANSSIHIPILAEEVTSGNRYALLVAYIKDGAWTDWDVVAQYNAKPGIVAYQSDGNKTISKAASGSYTAPDNALAVDITGTGITTVTSAEPNCLFVIGEGDPTPTGSDNIVVKSGSSYTAEHITLTDGHNFYSPVDFTATNIEFTYNNDRWADGTNGWNSIMLPFDVTMVKADDRAIDWFHSGSDSGKQFWLKRFVSDEPGVVNFDFADEMKANTPYIVAFPGDHWGTANDLSSKTLKFIGQDVTVHKGGKNASVTGSNYRFIGGTKAVDTENIYRLNAVGNRFELGNGSAPFRAYFKAHIFDHSESSLSIGNGSGTTGISEVRSKTEEDRSNIVYDLSGRRVGSMSNNQRSSLKRGLYIKNGKLFINQ